MTATLAPPSMFRALSAPDAAPPARAGMPSRAQTADWDGWVDEYGWRLLAHARQLLNSSEEAEDTVQNVLLELWRRTPEKTPDLPLALTKIRQRAIDIARSRNSRRAREDSWASQPERENIIDFKLADDGRYAHVHAALQTLDEIFREVVSLKLWSELTFDQIAEVLDISRNTAASRYRLALKKLRPLLTPKHDA